MQVFYDRMHLSSKTKIDGRMRSPGASLFACAFDTSVAHAAAAKPPDSPGLQGHPQVRPSRERREEATLQLPRHGRPPHALSLEPRIDGPAIKTLSFQLVVREIAQEIRLGQD